MTTDEAIHLIGVLKGLFPTLTPEQAFYLKREFLRYDAGVVEPAIDQHARVHPLVNIPRLLEQIREATRPREDWRKQSQTERGRVESERKQVDAALRPLSDQELERLKQDALAEMDPKSREFVEKADPKKSPTLRSLIYRRIAGAATRR